MDFTSDNYSKLNSSFEKKQIVSLRISQEPVEKNEIVT